VQGIEEAVTCPVKRLGSVGNRISIDFVGQGIAGNPLNSAVANRFEDSLNSRGFFANPRLVLMVREAIQTAGVEDAIRNSNLCTERRADLEELPRATVVNFQADLLRVPARPPPRGMSSGATRRDRTGDLLITNRAEMALSRMLTFAQDCSKGPPGSGLAHPGPTRSYPCLVAILNWSPCSKSAGRNFYQLASD
jgi:hypothetical protein